MEALFQSLLRRGNTDLFLEFRCFINFTSFLALTVLELLKQSFLQKVGDFVRAYNAINAFHRLTRF